jgi:hypothetical protein
MDFHLEWHKPLSLRRSRNGIYTVPVEKIPDVAGVYIFFREFGESQKALYVGKARNLKGRIKQQLDVVRLMRGVENAPKGARQLAFGVLKNKPGHNLETSLARIERALIRHYVSRGDELLNIHGSNITKHRLTSERTVLCGLIDKNIYFE